MHAQAFRARVVAAGNATGAEVPADVVDALDSGKRPGVAITINGHTWRSRVASKRGAVSRRHQRDQTRRCRHRRRRPGRRSHSSSTPNRAKWTSRPTSDSPSTRPDGHAAFDRLSFGLRRKHVNHIEATNSAQTRQTNPGAGRVAPVTVRRLASFDQPRDVRLDALPDRPRAAEEPDGSRKQTLSLADSGGPTISVSCRAPAAAMAPRSDGPQRRNAAVSSP
jgi:Domain of unknown function (DUF1905)